MDGPNRGEPRNFICLAAVSRRIYQIHRGICQIFPWKTVGPTYQLNLIGKGNWKNTIKGHVCSFSDMNRNGQKICVLQLGKSAKEQNMTLILF